MRNRRISSEKGPYSLQFALLWSHQMSGCQMSGRYTCPDAVYDNLSRRLQPGYNYVGQTNDRQPLLISAVGRLRDYLPTADCCVGPGRRAPNPPSILIPAVCCRSRILKHWSGKWARGKEPPAEGFF